MRKAILGAVLCLFLGVRSIPGQDVPAPKSPPQSQTSPESGVPVPHPEPGTLWGPLSIAPAGSHPSPPDSLGSDAPVRVDPVSGSHSTAVEINPLRDHPWIGPAVALPRLGEAIGDPTCAPLVVNDGATCSAWVAVDLLYWWEKKQSLPPSLVTTGSPSDPIPAALGQPGTQVLFGPSQADYGGLVGLRVRGGTWLDCNQSLGFQAEGFGLESHGLLRQFSSLSSGLPLLALRRVNANDGSPGAFVIASPATVGGQTGLRPGGLAISSDTHLWGGSVDAAHTFCLSPNFHLQGTAGVRYLDLRESVRIRTVRLASPSSPLFFLGNNPGLPATAFTEDQYHTRDQFLGGRVGLCGNYFVDRYFVGASASLALGQTNSMLDVTGASLLQPFRVAPQIVPGGLYALPSNFGGGGHQSFSLVPEGEFHLGILLTPQIRASIGYDILYWTRILRPGNQVNLLVDPREVPTDPAFRSGSDVNAPRPLANYRDFWAHGLSLAINFSF